MEKNAEKIIIVNLAMQVRKKAWKIQVYRELNPEHCDTSVAVLWLLSYNCSKLTRSWKIGS